MASINNYAEFSALGNEDKIEYLDDFIDSGYYLSYTVPRVKLLLNSIVIEEKNPYIIAQTTTVFIQLVLIGFLTQETLINFLLDDLEEHNEPFVQVARIKGLFLFYNGNIRIDQFLDLSKKHNDPEVRSEAYYRIGLLDFLMVDDDNLDNVLFKLQRAGQQFELSNETIENRIDAIYYRDVCHLIYCILSNQIDAMDTILESCLSKIWNLVLFSDSTISHSLEISIALSLKYICELAGKVTEEGTWLDYKHEFSDLFDIHKKLISLGSHSEHLGPALLERLRSSNQKIEYLLYSHNIAAAKPKIQHLLEDTVEDLEFNNYLKRLDSFIPNIQNSMKVETNLLVQLAGRYPNVAPEIIREDLSKAHSYSETFAIILGYEDELKAAKKTGFAIGQEILISLKDQIVNALPNYSRMKLVSFLAVLADVIRYVLRSSTEPKEFFPELYDSSLVHGRTEHIFQESLYRSLRSTELAARYEYESNSGGGGRIDIFYNDGTIRFPLEVKKTKTKPTWDTIAEKYIAQAISYANTYDQLGLFILFELSPKDEKPINDARELFAFQHLEPHYNLGNNFPNYIISAIVPGNRVAPSSLSNYG